MQGQTLLSDSSLSLLLHGLKACVALLINWLVLVEFASADYVTWAVTSSILVVATASDLGIGQFATTQFIHARPERWPAIARDAIIALVPLAIVAIAFVFVALGDQPALYKAAMAGLIGVRVLTIPFGAVLNAANQFKLRKAIELAAYLLSAVLIAWVAFAKEAVLWALLILNAAFTLGGFATMQIASRYLDMRSVSIAGADRFSILRVYRSSVPFMVNNLTGLLTYGGFVWISSFVLANDALAKLAILHTFILVNAYQVYDVILRARQADLVDPAHVARIRILNGLLMAATPLLALLFGGEILGVLATEVAFSRGEIVCFAAFVSIEFGFLMIQSITQVRPELAYLLSRVSLVKLTCQAGAIGVWWLATTDSTHLTYYVGTLAGSSLLGYIVCRWFMSSQLRSMGATHRGD